MTLTDATSYCTDLGSTVVVPENNAENDFYVSLIDEYTPMKRRDDQFT